jgi:hypothetical protein
MQIKFRVCYSKCQDPLTAQESLLNQWADSCAKQQIKFIKRTLLKFNTYDLLEYPDQELIKKEYTTYLATFNSDLSDENIDRCLKGFSEDYYLMELVITPEDDE